MHSSGMSGTPIFYYKPAKNQSGKPCNYEIPVCKKKNPLLFTIGLRPYRQGPGCSVCSPKKRSKKPVGQCPAGSCSAANLQVFLGLCPSRQRAGPGAE